MQVIYIEERFIVTVLILLLNIMYLNRFHASYLHRGMISYTDFHIVVYSYRLSFGDIVYNARSSNNPYNVNTKRRNWFHFYNKLKKFIYL